eukprot:403375306
MTCLAVSLNTTYFNFLYTTTASESVVNYGFVKIADNNNPVVVSRVQTSISQISNTLYPKNGFINSLGSKIFEIGLTTAINMQTYPHQVGYVTKHPINSLETCLQYTTQSIQISMNVQTSFSSGYINTLVTTLPSSVDQNNKLRIYSHGSYTAGDPIEMSTSSLLSLDQSHLPSPQCEDIPQGIISTPTFDTIYYIIGESYTIIKNGFSYSRSCSETLVWSYSATLTNGSALPSFIQFTGVHPQLSFSISTSDLSYAGAAFNIKISGILNGLIGSQTYLDVFVFSNLIPINESPFFIEKLPRSIQISTQQLSFYDLPQTYDPNGDLVSISLEHQFESSLIPIFIQLQGSKLVFNPQIADIGKYSFIIKVQDDNQFLPMNNQYIFKVVVVRPFIRDQQKPNITIVQNNENMHQNSTTYLQNIFSTFTLESLTFSKISSNGLHFALSVPEQNDNNQEIEMVTSAINGLLTSSVFGGIGASLIFGQFLTSQEQYLMWSLLIQLTLQLYSNE